MNHNAEYPELISTETLNYLHEQHENVVENDPSPVSVDLTIIVNIQMNEENEVNSDRKGSN